MTDSQQVATADDAKSSPNNTRMGLSARTFMLTVQNSLLPELDEIYEYCRNLAGFNYGLICSHNKGHNVDTLPHCHIVLQYTMPKRLSIKKLKGAHIDNLKYGSIQKMAKYAKGETGHDDIQGFEAKVIHEEGKMKENGGYRTTGADVREFKNVEEVYELPLSLQKIAKSIYEEKQAEDAFYSMLDEIRNDELKQPEVVYITGDSGKGKTYTAFKNATEEYENKDIGSITIENNFFSFINPSAKCFVIPEFRPSQCRATLLLEFLDKYGFSAPIKGGFKYIRPEKIYICSIIHPTDLYSDEKNKQFIRRINKLVELT